MAPFDLRAARIARAEGLGPERARDRVRSEDEDLAAFIRQVYRREVEDPLGYDLVLNLGDLTLDAAAGAVLSALRGKLTAPAR